MRVPRRKHWSDTVKRGLAHGYRSGLEEDNAKHLEALGEPVLFETFKVKYVVPASSHTYTADWELRNGIIVESKGIFDAKDRAKHLLIKLQYPGLDIRFVFYSAKTKIAPGSPTTVAEWADKHGYKWAEKRIPEAWVREPGPERKPQEVLRAGPVIYAELLSQPLPRKKASKK